jgi:arylsulfatase A-like enzyme
MVGVNLLDVAAGKQELKRDTVYGEVFVATAVKLDAPGVNLTARWLRSGDWKLIVSQKADAKPELFNLKDDPTELKELSATNGEKVVELRKKMNDIWENVK